MINHRDFIFYHIYTLGLLQAPEKNDYSQEAHKLDELEKWIPHIKDLGCNAVLLGPVLKSKSHGYDVTDYFQIDNRIGSNTEFRELVDHFHSAGISVVLDCVFNHCGRDFFAFRELCENVNEHKSIVESKDWFSGLDFSKKSPMGDSFTYDCWNGCYDLVKFNLKHKATRDYLLKAARFLVETFDIDGMRIDSANVIDFDFLRELRTLTTSIKPDFWLMGEVVAGDYAQWVNDEMLHSVTGYRLYKALYSSHNSNNFFELAYAVAHSVPDFGISHYNFLDNHDQTRIIDNVTNPDFLMTLYPLLFTLPGIPSIYYGSEWGINGKKMRTTDKLLRPYIDLPRMPRKTNLTELIKKLSSIRKSSRALRYGTYRQVYLQYHRPFVFERKYESERVLIAVNISDQTEFVNIENSQKHDLLTGEIINLSTCEIPPHSARILA